ncbi:DUF1989 domain-containing protein [Parasalinivibrio latis]|uniref:urea carboxylase-associated family protein n=1 Tax=Parasalinivibrio latis TaxID=2952610 RepID=UPI0030E1BE01
MSDMQDPLDMPISDCNEAPADAATRRKAKPYICVENEDLPRFDRPFYRAVRATAKRVTALEVPAKEAGCFNVPAGSLFRISCKQGTQVACLNLWQKDNLNEHLSTSETRSKHATHISTGDRLWSNPPYARPLVTVTYDSLAWYGWDEVDGAGVHDVIGSLTPHDCASLGNPLAGEKAQLSPHNGLNIFKCSGFTADSHQYFVKASPARKGDYLELFAETDLLVALSASPQGDFSNPHSHEAQCHPLTVEVFSPDPSVLEGWQQFQPSGYKPD